MAEQVNLYYPYGSTFYGEKPSDQLNINHDSKMNRLHEIFHTFGFVDFNESERGYGIMNYPPYQPGKEDANSLINNHFLPIIYE